jgi:hypothetical protein
MMRACVLGFLVVALFAVAAGAQERIVLEKVVTCRGFEDDGPRDVTPIFALSDLVICSFFARGMKLGDQVEANWKAADGTILRHSVYISGKPGDHYAAFGLKPRGGRWVPGVYTVELLVQGKVSGIASFTVEARPTAAGSAKPGRRFALLIGVGRYKDPEITPLRFTQRDVEAVRAVLADPRLGGIPAENIKVLTDADPVKPTRDAVGKALNWLKAVADRPDDTVILYFAGHGASDAHDAYLLAWDSEPATLLYTGLSMAAFNKTVAAIPARRKIVILDACHSGGLEAGEKLYQEMAGGDEVRFLSCRGDQSSYEDASLNHGVFTWFLVEGMRGKADGDRDGVVTVGELVPWVQEQVKRFSLEHGRAQTPVCARRSAAPIVMTERKR